MIFYIFFFVLIDSLSVLRFDSILLLRSYYFCSLVLFVVCCVDIRFLRWIFPDSCRSTWFLPIPTILSPHVCSRFLHSDFFFFFFVRFVYVLIFFLRCLRSVTFCLRSSFVLILFCDCYVDSVFVVRLFSVWSIRCFLRWFAFCWFDFWFTSFFCDSTALDSWISFSVFLSPHVFLRIHLFFCWILTSFTSSFLHGYTFWSLVHVTFAFCLFFFFFSRFCYVRSRCVVTFVFVVPRSYTIWSFWWWRLLRSFVTFVTLILRWPRSVGVVLFTFISPFVFAFLSGAITFPVRFARFTLHSLSHLLSSRFILRSFALRFVPLLLRWWFRSSFALFVPFCVDSLDSVHVPTFCALFCVGTLIYTLRFAFWCVTFLRSYRSSFWSLRFIFVCVFCPTHVFVGCRLLVDFTTLCVPLLVWFRSVFTCLLAFRCTLRVVQFWEFRCFGLFRSRCSFCLFRSRFAFPFFVVGVVVRCCASRSYRSLRFVALRCWFVPFTFCLIVRYVVGRFRFYVDFLFDCSPRFLHSSFDSVHVRYSFRCLFIHSRSSICFACSIDLLFYIYSLFWFGTFRCCSTVFDCSFVLLFYFIVCFAFFVAFCCSTSFFWFPDCSDFTLFGHVLIVWWFDGRRFVDFVLVFDFAIFCFALLFWSILFAFFFLFTFVVCVVPVRSTFTSRLHFGVPISPFFRSVIPTDPFVVAFDFVYVVFRSFVVVLQFSIVICTFYLISICDYRIVLRFTFISVRLHVFPLIVPFCSICSRCCLHSLSLLLFCFNVILHFFLTVLTFDRFCSVVDSCLFVVRWSVRSVCSPDCWSFVLLPTVFILYLRLRFRLRLFAIHYTFAIVLIFCVRFIWYVCVCVLWFYRCVAFVWLLRFAIPRFFFWFCVAIFLPFVLRCIRSFDFRWFDVLRFCVTFCFPEFHHCSFFLRFRCDFFESFDSFVSDFWSFPHLSFCVLLFVFYIR